MPTSDHLEPGLSPEAAVAAFEVACRQGPGLLFITDSWFAPYRARLLSALPPSLTDGLVAALQDALYKRRALETVVAFIEQQPMTWDDFARWEADRDRQRHVEEATRGFFPWADVDASAKDEALQRAQHIEDEVRARARPCPACGRPAPELTWQYFSSPAWTWEKLCGRAGWLTVCTPCHLQVDFFLDRMN